MSAFEELKGKLREIFQLDRNDLDFGLYRIINLKSEEINTFLENELLPQVKEGLKNYISKDNVNIQEELNKAIQSAKDLDVDPDTLPKVKELKSKLANNFDAEKIENEIYSNLYNFFKRYYSEGDFMSLRRYKDGIYALPYEGEEVKLHWANADQYYVKSGETLTNYTFKAGSHKVRFEVISATTEQNNNKDDKNRRFKLLDENPIRLENGEYIVSFSYLPDEKAPKQEEINKKSADTLLNNSVLSPIIPELNKLTGNEKNRMTTILKHLNTFTAKNTFDYFIHKDLGKFLRRELDFYIKNEIMHLDDIDSESEVKVEQYLGKIKILRKVANKIISFLAQLEDFQKKLWLKKKFVLETNYCITLDRVPEKLYPEIVVNEKQKDEWIKLFAINEIKGFDGKISEDFLKQNPYLVLDTQFFDNEFKYKIISSINNFDEQCNGLLVNSDNFQYLNLSQEKDQEKVKCIYIDPPYNTGSDGFVYKDGYSHSSWLSMMKDRLQLARKYLSDDGIIFISIDDKELDNLKKLCDSIFTEENFISMLVIETGEVFGVKASHADKTFVKVKDYILVYAKEKNNITNKRPLFDAMREVYDSHFNTVIEDNLSKIGFIEYIKNNKEIYDIFLKYKLKVNNENINLLAKIDTNFREWLFDDISKKLYADAPLSKKIPEEILNTKDAGIPFYYENTLVFKTKTNSVRMYVKYFDNLKQSDEYLTEYTRCSIRGDLWKNFHIDMRNVQDEGAVDFKNGKKPCRLIKQLLQWYNKSDALVLDYFAGSGTTGHAVINLNRINGENHKYNLVEMGNYFDEITKPRIEKVIYSEDWKNDKPVSRKGSSHCFKYIRLESYEDALDNLKMERTSGQSDLLLSNKVIKEEYMLNYMMDLETKGSLLNIDNFNHPFDYEMKITRDGETKTVKVDLVETFNYLIGLNVTNIRKSRNVIVIEGKTRSGEKTLILWRDTDIVNNSALDEWFKKQNYSTLDMEFDTIYVNGNNNLENLRKSDETWKVRLIEDEFGKRMFDVQDI